MKRPIATRVDEKGRSRPAWMDAPPRVRASTIAALRNEREQTLCILKQRQELS
jgi:hypothetical protein